VLRGLEHFIRTAGQAMGMGSPKVGSMWWALRQFAVRARVHHGARSERSHALAVPYGPPLQPVLTSHIALGAVPTSRQHPGIHGGMQRQERRAEAGADVACGSVTPRSVPASLAV